MRPARPHGASFGWLPFMRWCSEQGIAPAAVDTATLDAFMTDREETSLELACRQAAPGHRRELEQVRRRGAGLAAGRKLDLVPARVPWTLEVAPLHARLPPGRRCLPRAAGRYRSARRGWAGQAAAAGDPEVAPVPDPHGGLFAGRRRRAGRGDPSLEDVVRPEPFRRLIRNLVARYGGKTANIYGLATALKSIARHHCKLDDDELDALRKHLPQGAGQTAWPDPEESRPAAAVHRSRHQGPAVAAAAAADARGVAGEGAGSPGRHDGADGRSTRDRPDGAATGGQSGLARDRSEP